jgi:cytoskeletal protein CcmA (bactofilin family)
MFGRKKTGPITGRIDTLISKAARVQGDIEFAGGLHLDGRVQGHVRSVGPEPATLWISEQGTVEGGVEVPSVVINGTVIGDVHARERVAIGPQSRITGNVHYGTMEMTLGAQIDGKLIPMSGASAPTAQPARPVAETREASADEPRIAAAG